MTTARNLSHSSRRVTIDFEGICFTIESFSIYLFLEVFVTSRDKTKVESERFIRNVCRPVDKVSQPAGRYRWPIKILEAGLHVKRITAARDARGLVLMARKAICMCKCWPIRDAAVSRISNQTDKHGNPLCFWGIARLGMIPVSKVEAFAGWKSLSDSGRREPSGSNAFKISTGAFTQQLHV